MRQLARPIRERALGREITRVFGRGVRESREMAQAQAIALRRRVAPPQGNAEARLLMDELAALEAG